MAKKKETTTGKENILLPITEAEFEAFADKIIAKYKLPNKEHAMAVIANRIKHLPPDQATATMEYFGHCVLKNIAFQVADIVGSKVSHKVQVEDLVKTLTNTPNDAQARDQLEKFATEGSPLAKEALEKLGLPLVEKTGLKVVTTTEEQTIDASASNGSA
jgi:hypothetical protein